MVADNRVFNIRPTVFVDIDGTIVRHRLDFFSLYDEADNPNWDGDVLPGAKEKCLDWHRKGFKIIITTARPESMRNITEIQLEKAKILYDQIFFGVGGGPRVIINDRAYPEHVAAFGINVERDVGIKDIDLSDYLKKVGETNKLR